MSSSADGVHTKLTALMYLTNTYMHCDASLGHFPGKPWSGSFYLYSEPARKDFLWAIIGITLPESHPSYIMNVLFINWLSLLPA